MRTFENSLLKIEAFDADVPTWETSMLYITRKSLSFNKIKLNDVEYTFYSMYLRVDVSDFVRAMGSDEINVYINNNLQFTIGFDIMGGASPLVDELMPPAAIPMVTMYPLATNQFFVTYYLPEYEGYWWQKRENGVWTNLKQINYEPSAIIINQDTDMLRINIQNTVIQGSTFDGTFDGTFGGSTPVQVDNSRYFRIEKAECNVDYIYLEWDSELYGYAKSWFFKVMATVRGWDKSVNLYDVFNPDGFNVLKNKTFDFVIGVENADLTTRKYLADLCLADNVQLTRNGKRYPVFIDTRNVTTSNQDNRQSITFTVRFKRFETI